MLRKWFAGGNSDTKNVATLHSYLDDVKARPLRAAGLAALVALVAALFGWWYYSAATANSSQRHAETTPTTVTTESIAAPQSTPDTPIQSPSTPAPTDSFDAPTVQPDMNNQVEAEVEINNQPIPLPADGELHKTINTKDGQTKVDISIQSDTSGTSETRSSTSIELDSSTDSSIDMYKQEGN